MNTKDIIIIAIGIVGPIVLVYGVRLGWRLAKWTVRAVGRVFNCGPDTMKYGPGPGQPTRDICTGTTRKDIRRSFPPPPPPSPPPPRGGSGLCPKDRHGYKPYDRITGGAIQYLEPGEDVTELQVHSVETYLAEAAAKLALDVNNQNVMTSGNAAAGVDEATKAILKAATIARMAGMTDVDRQQRAPDFPPTEYRRHPDRKGFS